MARSGRSVRRRKQQHDQRHRVSVVVAICGAAVAALLCYQVFLRSDPTPTTATPSAAPAATADATSTTSLPQEPTLPNASFDELSVRDPFEPITQYSTATTTPTTVPVTPTTTPDGISTTPTTSPAQNPAPVSDITLVDVYVDASGRTTAVVRVNGAEFSEVHEGDAFATNYRLVRFTSTSCADFTYADSPFSLCTGQQTQK